MSEASAVEFFAPWASGEESAVRVRLHKARDVALVRMRRSKHSQARTLYAVAAQVASDWVFRRCGLADLEEIRDGLVRLFLVAGMIERIEVPDE